MSSKIQEAVNNLIAVVKEESDYETVAFRLFFTSSEQEYTLKNRSAQSLKNDGISMKNLKGDYIK